MNIETIAIGIKRMGWDEFRESDMWKTIAGLVKCEAGYKCSLCGSTERLEAHHNTYENHGYEWLYWRHDLVCLCRECHERFHKNHPVSHRPSIDTAEQKRREHEEISRAINNEKYE